MEKIALAVFFLYMTNPSCVKVFHPRKNVLNTSTAALGIASKEGEEEKDHELSKLHCDTSINFSASPR